jgi:hypothetical protein
VRNQIGRRPKSATFASSHVAGSDLMPINGEQKETWKAGPLGAPRADASVVEILTGEWLSARLGVVRP